MEQSRAAVNNI